MKINVQYFNQQDTKLSMLFGLVGGFFKMITSLDISFWHRIIEAGLIAMVSAVAGLVGKDLYVLIKKRIKKS